MHRAGFEPALPKETDLKSVALDHSANDAFNLLRTFYGALPTELLGNTPQAGLEPATPGSKGKMKCW